LCEGKLSEANKQEVDFHHPPIVHEKFPGQSLGASSKAQIQNLPMFSRTARIVEKFLMEQKGRDMASSARSLSSFLPFKSRPIFRGRGWHFAVKANWIIIYVTLSRRNERAA